MLTHVCHACTRLWEYDGEVFTDVVAGFLSHNPPEDNPEVDHDSVLALLPGQAITYGGGAAPVTVLRRLR